MMKNGLYILMISVLFACGNEVQDQAENGNEEATEMVAGEVNVLSHRFYDADKELYKRFENQTGIKVNVKEEEDDAQIACYKQKEKTPQQML